jgi:predicted MPP superfamily phosphohydrolase
MSQNPSKTPRVTRRQFLQLGCGALLGGAAACVVGPAYVTQVEPGWLEVTKVDVPLPGLPEALEGFTIVQLGDFHLGRYVSAQRVRRSVESANDLDPELIVLTGDFVYGSASYSEPCARELASLKAQCGVFAVLGNHDAWTGADQVAAGVEGAGIRVLRDEAQAVYVGNTRIWLLGVEDTGYTAGFYGGSFSDFRAAWQGTGDRLSTLLGEIPANEPRLLLVHNPDFTEMLPRGRIDLAVCGHTHGGQVHLPLLGRPVVPSCFGEKYASGLVRGPTSLVYVNRGIGLIAPPVRFNCRPEVTLLRLRSA